MKRSSQSLAIIAIGILLIELLACSLYRGPNPKSADAPDDQFSAERAISIHETLFPDQPHPGGSFQNQLVRDRLVETLQQLGLKVVVKQAVVESDAKVVLFNVLAEMPTLPLLARRHGARLAPVQGAPADGLRGHGGIGAILRYALEPVMRPSPGSIA